MFNFLMGFLLGSKHNKAVQLTPTEKTLNRHVQILEYVHLHPASTCSEIASALNLSCSDVNASLFKLERSGMVKKDNKKYIAGC